MTPDEAKDILTFAVALAKVKEAADRSEPVNLEPVDAKALIWGLNTVRITGEELETLETLRTLGKRP